MFAHHSRSGIRLILLIKPSFGPRFASTSRIVTPRQRYEELLKKDSLRVDKHQQKIVDRLHRLYLNLQEYDPPRVPPPTVPSRLGFWFKAKPEVEMPPFPYPPPHGLYLYGDVGTGKSMLMDLFYSTVPPHLTKRRRRVHFHAFMIDVHKRIHKVREEGTAGGIQDPILYVARDLANEACILCFDEFQVTDIADAMILRRLLEYLIRFGVVCVMTSNRHPTELYKNGIQRESFVPAIELLQEKFDVTDLNSGTDYRRQPRTMTKVYYHPLDNTTQLEMSKLFNAFTSHSTVLTNYKLPIWGNRYLVIPECSIPSTSGSEGTGVADTHHHNHNDGECNVARLTFPRLCGDPLSAADYIELTRKFDVIMVTDIPKLGLSQKDMARRFITFIDSCYESKTKLFTSSEVPIFEIFSSEKDANASKDVTDHVRSMMDDLGLSPELTTSSIFSGDEELFAWARCCSRLVEMGGADWGVDRFS